MHFIRLLLDLIQLEHQQRRQLEGIRRDTFELHRENLAEAKEIKRQLADIRQIAGDLLLVTQLIKEIHIALIPELVTAVKLSDESGESMDVQAGQPRQLKVESFGASGNPTVPVGATSITASNTTDFSVDSVAVTLTGTGAAGATTDVSAVVDGVTSNVLSYTIAAAAAEPVNSVTLSDVTP